MAKLTEFENPLTGKRQSLFDLGGMWSLILGVIVLLFITGTGQNIARTISNKVPGIDTQPETIFRQPVVVNQTTTKRVV